jgi:hypothetical protein
MDSARGFAEKLVGGIHISSSSINTLIKHVANLLADRDRELWTQAQEQMREKIIPLVCGYCDPSAMLNLVGKLDSTGEFHLDSSGGKYPCKAAKIRALPLDPLPARDAPKLLYCGKCNLRRYFINEKSAMCAASARTASEGQEVKK